MRISSLYIAIVLGVTLPWFHSVAARLNQKNDAHLHKHKVDIRKRNGQTLDLGAILGQGGNNIGPVNMAKLPGAPAPGPYPPNSAPQGPYPPNSAPQGPYPPSTAAPSTPPSNTLPLGGTGSGGLPPVPAISSGPLPIPAAPAIPLPLPQLPTLPSIPTLPSLGPLPGSDEVTFGSLDPFTPPEA